MSRFGWEREGQIKQKSTVVTTLVITFATVAFHKDVSTVADGKDQRVRVVKRDPGEGRIELPR